MLFRSAAGFAQPVTREQVRAAALDGSIERLLGWFQAQAGDTYLTHAGVVHALGAGLVVCEIQQTSDITYRLYDYARQPARELHLDHGLAVVSLGPHPGVATPVREQLAACAYFVTERWFGREPRQCERDSVVIVLSGQGSIDNQPFLLGQVWQTPAGTQVNPDGEAVLLRTYEP